MLIHFIRHKQNINASIEINEIIIQSIIEAKYLDIILDNKLKYKTHLDQVIKKEIKFALAIASIVKSNWRPEFKYLYRLFTAIAASRMNYAATI